MIKEIAHVGITVKNIEKSIDFYKNILGLKFKGELLMEGEETDLLFNKKNSKVRVAYLNGSDNLSCPPIELIEFLSNDYEKNDVDLHRGSISEICFYVDDIDKVYMELLDKGVEFISSPQMFDFSKHGFGKSKAVYFKDIDGIILELMEVIE